MKIRSFAGIYLQASGQAKGAFCSKTITRTPNWERQPALITIKEIVFSGFCLKNREKNPY